MKTEIAFNELREKVFVEQLKKVLSAYKIKHGEMAKHLKITKQAFSYYLSLKRHLSLEMVGKIYDILLSSIPKFNFMYLFDESQDMVLHEQKKFIYDDNNTLINSMNNDCLQILYKMLASPVLPKLLQIISKYFKTPIHLRELENNNFDWGVYLKSKLDCVVDTTIHKYFILLLIDIGGYYHDINTYLEKVKDILSVDIIEEFKKLKNGLDNKRHEQLLEYIQRLEEKD